MKKSLFVLAILFLLFGAANSNAQTIPGPPCTTGGSIGFQYPNIGNTTNWGQCLNYDLQKVDGLLGGMNPLSLNVTTPSVAGHTNWLTANTSSITLTNFTGGYTGQHITILCGISDTFTQVLSNVNISINAPWACADSKSLSLVLTNGIWIESGRAGGGGGGGGGVSIVTGHNLSPLFSLSIGTPTTAPELTFSPISVGGSLVYANCSASAGIPNFCSLTAAMIPVIPLGTGVSGILPHASLPTLLSGDIPNNAANTSGTAAQAVTLTQVLSHSLLPTLLSTDIPNNTANTSGNAGTASALAANPTNCGAGQAAGGVAANGNAEGCFTPGGGLAVSTNSTPNLSQSVLNFVSSAATNGITITFTNASSGNVALGLTGTLTDAGLTGAYSGVGTCTSGKFADAFTRANAPNCDFVDYSVVTNTPTLFYQTFKANGSAQTQRPTINLINGPNITNSCVDNPGSLQTDCTITASVTASTSFGALTPATNSTAGTFSVSGNAWDFGAATSLKIPGGAGYSPTANGSVGYDTSVNKYVFGQNGSTVSFGLASSAACGSHQWVSTPATAIAQANCTQPNFTDLTGTATAAQLPNPSVSTLGGVQAYNAVTHQFLDSISTAGVPHSSQPSLSDLATGTAGAAMLFPGGTYFAGGVNAQAGTSYTILASDGNKLITFNNASAVAVTLNQPVTTGFTNGAAFHIFNRGAGAVTITSTSSTINGNATVTLNQNQGAFIESDGGNYGAWVSASPTGGGTVTSVGALVNGGSSSGIFSWTGSPVTSSGSLNLVAAGTSGAIPYFSTTSILSSSALLAQNGVMIGGGAGSAPATVSPSTTVTQAFFATAGAPGFRNIGTSDTSVFWYAADSGAANAYVVAPSPAVTALAVGVQVSFSTTHANSGGSTINVNGLGVKNITKYGTVPLTSGDILSGTVYTMAYDGTEWQLGNPSTGIGTVTSVGLSAPSWLNVSGTPITNNGTFAVTAATGQASHQVIGTCNTASSFAPCTLVLGDLPTGLGLTSLGLNQFAGTSSANFLSTITDEIGTGLVMGNNSPTIITPTIASFLNATHNHSNVAGGGTLSTSVISPNWYIAAGGSVNALTATLSPAATSLASGLEVHFLPNLANTSTAPTLNVNGLGAVTVTKQGATALVAGDLSTTAIAVVIYDGTRWQLQNPQASGTAITGTGTTGVFAQWTASGVIGNGPCDYGVTTAGVITCTAPFSIGGTGNGIAMGITTAPGGLPGSVLIYADPTDNAAYMNNNNSGPVRIIGSGVDINTLFQVTSTHLSSALPFNQGGLGTTTNFLAHTFFGNCTGSTAAPASCSLNVNDTGLGAYVAGGGAANVQTATLSPAPTALFVGLEFNFLPIAANTTTTPTLNLNALGAKTITKQGTTALAASDLTTAAIAKVIYDGTNWQLQNPQTSSGGGGGSGTVTSVAQTVPSWLSVAGSPVTVSGTLAITAATGQTSHQVIGTCNAATSFAPCALVAGDLPNIPMNQVISPTGAITPIALGNNPLSVTTAQTTSGQTGISLGEATASTSAGTPYQVRIFTLGGSTSVPLNLTNSLTGSQALSTLFLNPTLNTTGSPTILLVNATNTASGASTKLFDFQLGGTSQIYGDKSGNTVQLGASSTGTSSPACTVGTAGYWCANIGTPPTNVSGASALYPDGTQMEWYAATNGTNNYGLMLRQMPGAVHATAQTAAIGTATLCAASAGACNKAGLFKVSAYIYQTGSCTSAVAGAVGIQLTWTDAQGTKSAVQMPLSVTGGLTFSNTMTFSTTANTAYASGDITIWSTGANAIQYATNYTACTTGTGTYEVDLTAYRIQ